MALCASVCGLLASTAPAPAAGDVNTASCANEALAGFQSYLADCRAWEMVSPSFTDGFVVDGIDGVSGDGTRLLVESAGTFGGTESYPGGRPLYELSRTSSGWGVSGLGPPASRFPASGFVAAGTDLGRTLWELRDSSESINAEDLYVREGDGSFVKVGPMVPPSKAVGPPAGGSQGFIGSYVYAGASKDLSHVLFTVEHSLGSVLWPGAGEATGEGGKVLYEYVGTGGRQPAPVGVNGEGRALGDCSTLLGADNGNDVYNAVSADGETVFFMVRGHSNQFCSGRVSAPEVSELFARLGGIETVSISEPAPRQCGECNTAVRAPAEFQGASQDGSRVFFLTEQALLEGATTMNLYEYDFHNPDGQQVVRVSVGSSAPEVQGVARVSQDGSHVYFVAKGVLTQGANAQGREPVGGANNLYQFERDAAYPGGRTVFIATLSSETSGELEDAEAPCAALAGSEKEECEEPFVREFRRRNQQDSEDWQLADTRPVQATPDGRFLVFLSAADLTPGDTSSRPQVFEYDSVTGELVRVSVGQAGYAGGTASADSHASLIEIQRYVIGAGFLPSEADTSLAVSADGSTVVFKSAGALAPGAETAAAAGAQSYYEYRSGGRISNGNVYLVSDGRDVSRVGNRGMMLDQSGEDIFFATADPLVAQDLNTQFDVYDARAGGGFQPAPGMVVCAGEACQGAPAAQTSPGVPGSVSVPGTGNLSPSPSGPVTKPKAKPPARAHKLAVALRACRRKHGRKRALCEARARKRYGVLSAVNVKGKG